MLDYISANLNSLVKVPDICSRGAYCFKRVVLEGKNSNLLNFLDTELVSLIEESIDEFEYKTLDL